MMEQFDLAAERAHTGVDLDAARRVYERDGITEVDVLISKARVAWAAGQARRCISYGAATGGSKVCVDADIAEMQAPDVYALLMSKYIREVIRGVSGSTVAAWHADAISVSNYVPYLDRVFRRSTWDATCLWNAGSSEILLSAALPLFTDGTCDMTPLPGSIKQHSLLPGRVYLLNTGQFLFNVSDESLQKDMTIVTARWYAENTVDEKAAGLIWS